jgi:hypothetical protein
MVRLEVNRHRLSPTEIPEFCMPGLSVALFQSPTPVDLEMRLAGKKVKARLGLGRTARLP